MIRAGQSAFAALLVFLLALPASAQELRMGVQAPFVVDPHWLFLGPNMAASRHIFDSLVGRDEDARWVPSLAESWRQVDPLTWEFALRRGVRFHDGSPFTAADVAASIARIPNLQGNPGPFTPNIRTIVRTEIIDDYTIRLHTDRPNPTLPGQLTNVFIIPAHLAGEPGEASGTRVAVGTGPYRLVSFRYGEGMTLERNDGYWGDKPDFARVQIKVISNDAAREAALLAGDIDLMENVPPDDVARLRADKAVRVFARAADRVVFLLPNTGADTLALLTEKAGQKLASNPLRDLRVRQAMSLAIDRVALVDRALSGQGVPSMQLVPQGFVGWSDVPVPKADPAAARRLLAEAGYPDGFRLSIACTNDRYIYDARICQVLAQMLSRAGLQAAVETMPGSLFMPKTRAGRNEMPLILYAISLSSLRDVGYILPLVAHSVDEGGGFGDGNRGSFSDPELDRMIENAIVLSGPEREQALKAAQAETVRLLGMIPLYHEYTIAAARAGITYRPRIDQQMVATGARRD
ncbi:MAG: ABC transporter substrate-binding protein [Acetobacteraceae bacterium]|nr:ABC transporter substrate-binding protein [Acetobacteraceae bacterium]